MTPKKQTPHPMHTILRRDASKFLVALRDVQAELTELLERPIPQAGKHDMTPCTKCLKLALLVQRRTDQLLVLNSTLRSRHAP